MMLWNMAMITSHCWVQISTCFRSVAVLIGAWLPFGMTLIGNAPIRTRPWGFIRRKHAQQKLILTIFAPKIIGLRILKIIFETNCWKKSLLGNGIKHFKTMFSSWFSGFKTISSGMSQNLLVDFQGLASRWSRLRTRHAQLGLSIFQGSRWKFPACFQFFNEKRINKTINNQQFLWAKLLKQSTKNRCLQPFGCHTGCHCHPPALAPTQRPQAACRCPRPAREWPAQPRKM